MAYWMPEHFIARFLNSIRPIPQPLKSGRRVALGRLAVDAVDRRVLRTGQPCEQERATHREFANLFRRTEYGFKTHSFINRSVARSRNGSLVTLTGGSAIAPLRDRHAERLRPSEGRVDRRPI